MLHTTYQWCTKWQLSVDLSKYTPSVGVRGEFGWLKPRYERWRNMCRYWNRLLSISNSRILYKIFRYDYEICKNNWCSELKAIFAEIDNQYVFTG